MDGGWNSWSPWSECSVKCGGGYRSRFRKCNNPPPQIPGGMDCPGSPVEYELCNSQQCSNVIRLSEWTPWVSMGNGTERRFKFVCKAPVGEPKLIKISLSKDEDRVCGFNGCYRPGNFCSIRITRKTQYISFLKF